MVAPKQFLDYVDTNSVKFIDRLSEAVAIPRYVSRLIVCTTLESKHGNFLTTRRASSISGDASRRGDVLKMASWVQTELEKFGVKTEAIPLGTQHIEGQVLDLPPAIVGKIGDDPKKKTILVYGHFDVQPVSDFQ